jgi:fatty acid desaturase
MLNHLLELIFGFQTGVVTNGWVLHHVLGHHPNYLDQERDQSRWKRKDGQTMGEVEYSLFVALTAYPRAFQVGKRFPRHQRPFLAMSLCHAMSSSFTFYTIWVNALFIYALPMMISLYITSWHTYYHHAGLDTDNDFEASYNNTDKWFDFLTGNLGCHTAHHARPALHWSKLREFHREIESRIPARLYRRAAPPFCWLAPLLRNAGRVFRPMLGD